MFELVAFALALATASPAKTPNAKDDHSDAAIQQKMEGIIQACIRERAASPYICRASAYATALSQGYSPERAARLTGFKRK